MAASLKDEKEIQTCDLTVWFCKKNAGDSGVRDANKVSRKDKGSFVVKEKCLLWQERGDVSRRNRLELKPSIDGRVPLEDHMGSTLARFPWKSFPKYPQGSRESLLHWPGAPAPPAPPFGVRLWGCSWIYKAGLCRMMSGAAKPPELLWNCILPGSLSTQILAIF